MKLQSDTATDFMTLPPENGANSEAARELGGA
jgi:hypothetical protein